MDSRSEPENPSEGPAPEENVSGDLPSAEDSFRRFDTTGYYRSLPLYGGIGYFATLLSDYTSKGTPGWGELAFDFVLLGLFVLAFVDLSQRSVLVGEDEIRIVRLLWKDRAVPSGEVRRVHVPTTQEGLWLYTDPDGDVALKIGAGHENADELKELVIRQIPSSAEVTGLG
jgi:hypothetical protein